MDSVLVWAKICVCIVFTGGRVVGKKILTRRLHWHYMDLIPVTCAYGGKFIQPTTYTWTEKTRIEEMVSLFPMFRLIRFEYQFRYNSLAQRKSFSDNTHVIPEQWGSEFIDNFLPRHDKRAAYQQNPLSFSRGRRRDRRWVACHLPKDALQPYE